MMSKYKFLVAILIFVNISVLGQEESILIEPILENLVKEYINEGRVRGFDSAPIIFKNVDTIMLDSTLKYPMLGYYDMKFKSIHIARFTLIDRVIVKAVLYHELTHSVLKGYGHVCYKCRSLMSEKSPDSFSKYAIKEVWDETLDELFIIIELILEKDEEKRTQNNIQR